MHPVAIMRCLGWERWAVLGWTGRQAEEESWRRPLRKNRIGLVVERIFWAELLR